MISRMTTDTMDALYRVVNDQLVLHGHGKTQANELTESIIKEVQAQSPPHESLTLAELEDRGVLTHEEVLDLVRRHHAR
jgi:hypothetical protein